MTNMLQDGVSWLAGKLENHASESVTYRDADGTETTLTATVTEESVERRDTQNGIEVVRKRTCSLLNPSITTVNSRGTIKVSGTEYSVTDCSFKDEAHSMMVFQIERQESGEKSREGYRRRNL
jgi:hypothetical protein